MIGWICGEVKARDITVPSVIIDVRGVGYELFVDPQTLASLPADGGGAELWVHTYVKEEALALYGFTSLEARTMFRLLLSAHKVGPKIALATLGGFALEEIVEVLRARDAKRLQRVQGIGAKMAEQIMVSIGDKAQRLFAAATGSDVVQDGEGSSLAQRAQETLVAWGFKNREVEAAVAKVEDELGDTEISLEELLRRAAQEITSGG